MWLKIWVFETWMFQLSPHGRVHGAPYFWVHGFEGYSIKEKQWSFSEHKQ